MEFVQKIPSLSKNTRDFGNGGAKNRITHHQAAVGYSFLFQPINQDN